MSITAVSFDFWNTLFIEPKDGFGFYANRRHTLLSEAVREHRPVTYEEIRFACAEEARLHHQIWTIEHRTLRAEERIATCVKTLGVSLPAARMSDLALAFEEGILERPPVPIDGAREVINKLSGKYRLGIISDVGFSPGRILKRILADAGLADAFDSLVFSDEAGRSKPHLEVFTRTSRTLESRPEQMAHIGDLEHTDVIGAKRAGYTAVRFVGITPMLSDEKTEADRVISDLRDLPELLDEF